MPRAKKSPSEFPAAPPKRARARHRLVSIPEDGEGRAARPGDRPQADQPVADRAYFFHECPRYLRYSSTPKELWDVEGVPDPSLRP